VSAGHRHTTGSGHEHEFEPQRGLPEVLPPGERLLWQGSPDWLMLARRVFHVRKLVVYFGALLLLRGALRLADGASIGEALYAVLQLLPLAALGVGLLALMAWLSARAAVYTITDKRVVMRIGIVLTLTFNIPFKRITGAGLHLDTTGTGDLPLTLDGSDRIAWLHLWPHARPWKLAQPQPMLRCVPEAAHVAQLLAAAWSKSTGLTATAVDAPAGAGSPAGHAVRQPALAGR
jgi:hypothetical protein